MTNTERITTNNENLRNCIEIAENLPNAGNGGGSVEAWMGTVYGKEGMGLGGGYAFSISYIDENLTLQSAMISSGDMVEITIASHTIIAIGSPPTEISCENATAIIDEYENYYYYAVHPTANNFAIWL